MIHHVAEEIVAQITVTVCGLCGLAKQAQRAPEIFAIPLAPSDGPVLES